MKAVILARCQEATLVDVSHGIPAFDLHSAAFVLWAGTRHFPPGTVHLAVVDPGVGTARKAVAVQVGGSHYVAPDNGILTTVLREAGPAGDVGAVELARPAGASRTFEGRDVFAPAAAALAAGQPLQRLGGALDTLVRLPEPGPSVVWVDAFGNLVTNVKPPVRGLRINGYRVEQQAETFGAAPGGRMFHYVGSMGFVEVAVREERADALLGAGPGTPVEVL
jgi:S-adenosyl-L-methionine hydrolase (adenosine-forming)